MAKLILASPYFAFLLFKKFQNLLPRFLLILSFLQLLWIILVASCSALVIQSLAANLGVVTGIYYYIFSFSIFCY